MPIQKIAIVTGWFHSGTERLTTMLSRHPAVFAPPKFGVMMADTLSEQGLKAWAYQHAGLQLNNLEATGLGIPMQTFADMGMQNEWEYIYEKCYELGCRTNKHTIFLDHTPNYTAFRWRAENRLPDAKYIYVLRDPRAVFAEWKDSVSTPDISKFIQQYTHAVQASRRSNAGISVSYEKLVLDPRATLRPVCDYLEIDLIPSMLDGYGNVRGLYEWLDSVPTPNVENLESAFSPYASLFPEQIWPVSHHFEPNCDKRNGLGVLLLHQPAENAEKLAALGWTVRALKPRNGPEIAQIDVLLALEHARRDLSHITWGCVGGLNAAFLAQARQLPFHRVVQPGEDWIGRFHLAHNLRANMQPHPSP